MKRIAECRTAALGGHLDACTTCGFTTEISYDSCRDRHCPKCQGSSSATWFRAREEDLLPVPYFHVTCTLPDTLRPIALQNKAVLYNLLLKSSAEALKKAAAKPHPLGAQIGFFGILHTWGQLLPHHPHVHWVVPGGGISLDGSRWVPSRKDYLVPTGVVATIFRRKFLDGLEQAFRSGELSFYGSIAHLQDPAAFRRFLRPLRKKKWVVDARAPFAGPRAVVAYLARYTHRVAISNHRILHVDDSGVTFRYKDYAKGGRTDTKHLSGVEFLRRFLLHVLPKGFVRIRHYGFLAHRNRTSNLKRCRQLIAEAGIDPIEEAEPPSTAQSGPDESQAHEENAGRTCPRCKQRTMVRIETRARETLHVTLAFAGVPP